jgi:hypothetical protein
MATLDLHPGAYTSRKGFRPVIRTYRDGVPHGSKASGFLFATRAEAESHARIAALNVALNYNGASLHVAVH